jgi:hypothetical protein
VSDRGDIEHERLEPDPQEVRERADRMLEKGGAVIDQAIDLPAPAVRIVTRDQLAEGWLELFGCVAYRRQYEVVGALGDGTFCVKEPQPS